MLVLNSRQKFDPYPVDAALFLAKYLSMRKGVFVFTTIKCLKI